MLLGFLQCIVRTVLVSQSQDILVELLIPFNPTACVCVSAHRIRNVFFFVVTS